MPSRIIKPTEYYDEEHGGSIPVFRPTYEEFKDFRSFMESIDDYGKKSGIVKIIPPKEWKENLPDFRTSLEHTRIRNPIVQHIIGSKGIYTQTNVVKRRPYTLEQWFRLSEQDEHRPPKIGIDRSTRKPESMRRKKKRPCEEVQEDNQISQELSLDTREKKKTKRQVQAEEVAIADTEDPIPLCFDPQRDADQSRFNIEYCKDLERAYWRSLSFSQPMYGADMNGTLFDDSVQSWNVGSLDNLLNRMKVVVPGVNTPYLYFGMWKATFPWHVEDMDLYSINYLHFGAPKQWYAISPLHRQKFESVMQTMFYQEYKECSEFLRHKTFLVSPKLLSSCSVPVSRCVQHAGEFMVTFPFGYHAGYNLGFNCAESINFALDSWIEIGKRAKPCQCIGDSVRIDVEDLETNVKGTRGTRRKPKA